MNLLKEARHIPSNSTLPFIGIDLVSPGVDFIARNQPTQKQPLRGHIPKSQTRESRIRLRDAGRTDRQMTLRGRKRGIKQRIGGTR